MNVTNPDDEMLEKFLDMVDQIEELIFEIQATHTVNDTHMVSYDDLRSDNSKKLLK